MILALESSCDETAVALFDPARGISGEWIHSQIVLQGKYGGVVPDLATREHLRNFGPLLQQAKDSPDFERVTKIAVTSGPGLAACLAIGVAAAKSLALALQVPIAGVNHLRGHVWSPFIALHAESPAAFEEKLAAALPHLGLIVSGGNTLLFVVGVDRRIVVLSSTRDDAAGEALDKGAKLLGLGYPGGPLIEKLAQQGRADAFDFPRGIGKRDELDFSFSGVKTSLRYQIEKMSPVQVRDRLPDLCASYQQAVLDSLVRKTRAALRLADGRYRSLGLSGGVANNRALRSLLEREARNEGIPFFAAQPQHTGDNAGMIAFAAWVDPTGSDQSAGMSLGVAPSAVLAMTTLATNHL
ncbi:MAG TPA: tRNA (adenosine(37)-N6)-threonylcarbamoyltransferase complex transferase subunit TsaD [Opitutus sp.]|nr:tRNA (adenosine(37)-N6)-threonylcarbamoyltransferase complex transferase subunit TsaD [Opitutus sp.]